VVGASAGSFHTAVWTEEGEFFTFMEGIFGHLGHGGHQREYVPRLVEALAGKKVVGAAAGGHHTAVWTEAGELFTFGVEAMGGWAMEGKSLSLCRGWSSCRWMHERLIHAAKYMSRRSRDGGSQVAVSLRRT